MAIRQGSHHLFISLKFVNLIALTQSLSIVDLTSQLAEFSGRLRNLLRTTDIFCQYSDDTLFFLLSDVAQNSVKIIEHKLATISTEQQENPLELSASLHLLPIHELSNDVDFWLTQRAHELTK
jgi:GGDEF domain-containing protein